MTGRSRTPVSSSRLAARRSRLTKSGGMRTMAIIRWSDPFREFAQLQDRINRAFTDYGRFGSHEDGLMTSGSWLPPVDIYQNGEHEVVLKAELPDMTREAIDVTVENGTLTIRGEKRFSE